eukprot:9198519-Pyramimonas_sp.AAC.1
MAGVGRSQDEQMCIAWYASTRWRGRDDLTRSRATSSLEDNWRTTRGQVKDNLEDNLEDNQLRVELPAETWKLHAKLVVL